MSVKIKATVTLCFDDEFIGDILVTAFDGAYGGCWYWAEPKGPNWLVTTNAPDVWRSCTIREKDASSGKKKWAVVDHAMVGRGLQRVLQHAGYDRLRTAIFAKESGDIDASAADTIIQFAIFGEEVYG